MFVTLMTARGEKMFLNVSKIFFFSETKKGCSVVLDDGTMIDLSERYEDIVKLIMSCK